MAVLFASESILRNCAGRLGYPDNSLFVMLEDEAFKILEDNDYALSAVCKVLRVPAASWSNQRVFLVQIPNEALRNVRIPCGNEAGVDQAWIPGGVHVGGFKQAVIDPVDLDRCGVMEIKWKS